MAAERRYPEPIPVPLDVLRPLGAQRRSGELDREDLDVLRVRLATRQGGEVARGRLIRVHRGVYAVGHAALSDRARMIAALLVAGPGAALSHRTAAHLWGLLPSMPSFVDVTLTDRTPRRRPGLCIHRAAALDTGMRNGLRVTTPLQTIAQLQGAEADRARAEALVRRLVPRDADDHTQPTRSALERALLPALAAARLPEPRCNHPGRGPRGRLRLAAPARRRRDRRLARARPPRRLRARSRARRAAPGRRLRDPPLHLSPGRRGDHARDGADRPGPGSVRWPLTPSTQLA